jgi:5-(carboxyamino)imidazole ribonucleotide synthase
VQILRSEAQLADFWDTPSLVEPFLADSLEIAVLLARDPQGNCRVYPTFGMDFDPHLNALNCVYTPAAIPETLSTEARALGERIVSALGGVGVFAIEMFVSPAGELLVNEISPRVHNSGHLTMEASDASQFEQHVRAVCGLPLQSVDDTRPAAMVNILYRDELESACPGQPEANRGSSDHLTLHWYGKPPGRQGRKMGHITAVAEDADTAAKEAQHELAELIKKADNQAA